MFPLRSISNLTLVDTSTKAEESVVLAFSAKVFPDGSIYNVAVNKDKAEEAKRGSDARGTSSSWSLSVLRESFVY